MSLKTHDLYRFKGNGAWVVEGRWCVVPGSGLWVVLERRYKQGDGWLAWGRRLLRGIEEDHRYRLLHGDDLDALTFEEIAQIDDDLSREGWCECGEYRAPSAVAS